MSEQQPRRRKAKAKLPDESERHREEESATADGGGGDAAAAAAAGPASAGPSKRHRANRQKVPEAPVYEKENWLIHLHYVHKDFHKCKELIDKMLDYSHGVCEYALYVKALILRQEGDIHESLRLFQSATLLNPQNVANLKQVGRSLYLLGKHVDAIKAYESALTMSPDDWEIHHNLGVCWVYMGDNDQAVECFKRANGIQKHDVTYTQLGRVYALRDDVEGAVHTYKEALAHSPENSEFLTTLGLLHMHARNTQNAFDCLGNSLTYNPKDPKTILAAGSIIQDCGDYDVALLKYRVAAVGTPESAHLWNNVGMCLFGQQKLVAAIACLKRAAYLAPFEWIVYYNLGLVHLTSEQYASSFHYFSAAINLRPEYAPAYMLLAITLTRLDDHDNAAAAYEKALQLDQDMACLLNYAVALFNRGERKQAAKKLLVCEQLLNRACQEDEGSVDPALVQTHAKLRVLLKKELAKLAARLAKEKAKVKVDARSLPSSTL